MFDDVDPFSATPAELLAAVVDLEPGPLVLSALLMLDRSALSSQDAITYLQVHERLSAWMHSLQADVLVAAATEGPVVEELTLIGCRDGRDEDRVIRIEDAVREEVASALRWSPVTAQHRIDSARLLAGPLRETRDALGRGEISAAHVSVIIESADRLPGRHANARARGADFELCCAELQRRVLPIARRGTVSMTRAAGRRAVLAIDAEGERRRRLAARCTRAVYVVDELDGLSTLCARLSTETAHAIYAAIDAHAHANPGTGPAAGGTGHREGDRTAHDEATGVATIGERRAAALVALVLGTPARGAIGSGAAEPAAPVSRAQVDVVISLEALLGADESPAHLRGCGPVHPDLVRDLLLDPSVGSSIRRLATDPVTGHLLDIGRRSYEVTDGLRRFIERRDQFCRFPGCRRSAARSQIDHAVAWDDGGVSDRGNLGNP